MPTTISAVETAITEFLVEEVLDGESEDLNLETPLLEYGLLDSLSLAKLVATLETSFDAKIPTDQLSPDNLQTIQHIARLVTASAR